MAEEQRLQLSEQRTFTYRLCAGIVAIVAKVLFRPTVVGQGTFPSPAGPHRANSPIERRLRPHAVHLEAQGLLHGEGLALSCADTRPSSRTSGLSREARRGDRESMTLSEEVLRQGHALVLFPEGTRKEGRAVAPCTTARCSSRRARERRSCRSGSAEVTGPCPRVRSCHDSHGSASWSVRRSSRLRRRVE